MDYRQVYSLPMASKQGKQGCYDGHFWIRFPCGFIFLSLELLIGLQYLLHHVILYLIISNLIN